MQTQTWKRTLFPPFGRTFLFAFSSLGLVVGIFLGGCYPRRNITSHELRPVLTEVPSALSISEEELAKNTPRDFVSTQLPNGLKVSILPDPSSATTAVYLFYHVGLGHDDKYTQGLSHLLEHLHGGSTKKYKKGEYDDYLNLHGAQHNAMTTPDFTLYHVEILSEHHEPILAFYADQMENLLLGQEAVDVEKKVVSEELRLRQQNSPAMKTGIKIVENFVNGHPYGGAAGNPETIEHITLTDVQAFYRDYYHPSNAHLVIVGPVDPRKEADLVKKYFEPISDRGIKPPPIPSLLTWPFAKEAEYSQALFPVKAALLVYPLPPLQVSDAQALSLLVQMLCPGESSSQMCQNHTDLLYQDLVKKQRSALEAGVSSYTAKEGGALYFYAVYLPYRRKSTAFQLIEDKQKELKKQEWLTEERLQSAKRTYFRDFYLKNFSVASQAFALGNAMLLYGDARYFFLKKKILQDITLSDIERVFQKYLVKQTPIKLYLTPEEVPAWITMFGWMYPVVAK